MSIAQASLLIQPLHGQVLYGSVTGTVTDPSGAIVPGAQVTVTNEATGLKRQTTTDAAGNYRVLDLPQGNYTIEVTASGFKPLKVTSITILIEQMTTHNSQPQADT